MVNNINKTNSHRTPQLTEHKKTQGPGSRQARKCGRVDVCWIFFFDNLAVATILVFQVAPRTQN